MKISLAWLADYIDTAPLKSDLKGVLAKLTMRGLEVEGVHDLSAGLSKVIVAKIEVRDRHPNADRLSVCRVSTGRGNETLQIVCGAQNMKAGDKVALSMIGACLPNGAKIDKGKIRDVESFGMLCSEVELGFAEQSEGILILPADAPVGEDLAKYLGRDDVVFELNVTPNRGDALSHYGVARELALVLGQKLKVPPSQVAETGGLASDKIKVALEAPEHCWQYHARFIDGVKVKESPEWLKKRLTAVGLRPINNVVDVTNFILMELGQPLHAFDYAQVKGGEVRARMAKAGEKIPLLDGSEVALDPTDLVIADAARPVALAGVMGGGNSEVTDKTTSILLEAAQFAPSAVRKTARRHQKHSDSSHRFERQIDGRAVRFAMDRAARLILETAGGKASKGIVSKFAPRGEALANGPLKTIEITADAANKFLGTTLSAKESVDCLRSAGFEAEAKSGAENAVIRAVVPGFRPDVESAVDLYEEILRTWGYDRVEAKVPRLEFIPSPANAAEARFRALERLKSALTAQGLFESVNFAFESKAAVARWGGEGAGQAVELKNPLNEDFAVLKTSLLGGLIENLLTGVRHQGRDLRLFEVRPVYQAATDSDTGVREEWRVAAIVSGRAYGSALEAQDRDLDFFDAKCVLESALDALGARGVRYMAFDGGAKPDAQPSSKIDTRFHPAQVARIALGRGPCGVIGRLHPKLESELKLRQSAYLFEFSLDRALEVAKTDRKFSALPKFPKIQRDLSLLVPRDVSAEKVVQAVQKAGKPLVESVAVVDLYAGDKIPAGTLSLSVSMTMGDSTRTLEDPEVEAATQKILAGLDRELGVKLRLQ